MSKPTAILLISCPDQRGIVARLAGFVYERGGNIVDSDHHSDLQAGRFLGRIEWEDDSDTAGRAALRQELAAVADATLRHRIGELRSGGDEGGRRAARRTRRAE